MIAGERPRWRGENGNWEQRRREDFQCISLADSTDTYPNSPDIEGCSRLPTLSPAVATADSSRHHSLSIRCLGGIYHRLLGSPRRTGRTFGNVHIHPCHVLPHKLLLATAFPMAGNSLEVYTVLSLSLHGSSSGCLSMDGSIPRTTANPGCVEPGWYQYTRSKDKTDPGSNTDPSFHADWDALDAYHFICYHAHQAVQHSITCNFGVREHVSLTLNRSLHFLVLGCGMI